MTTLYQSEAWTSLDALDRAQLLLVIEGLKRGTIISGNWTSCMDVLQKTALDYQLNSHRYRLDPVLTVARPEDLQAYQRRCILLPEKAKSADFHTITGWLLSYPACCTAEYIKKRTPEQKKAQYAGQHHLSY